MGYKRRTSVTTVPRPPSYPRSRPRPRTTRGFPLSPRAGRGPAAPRRAAGKRRRNRSGGEGGPTDEAPPFAPPHRRLPPRFADDEVGKALSPHAGRGDARAAVLLSLEPSSGGACFGPA
ncbi:hypothetical protein FV226_08790 [Methylobacterium sp. WL12]|nr:hypothetical protein FV226_08790 [Methylobacterium sp. WL12]